MKYKIIIFLLILVSSCCLKKEKVTSSNNKIINVCPNVGNCSIEILKNKSMLLNSDFGKLNYTLIDDFEKDVIRYQYSKDLDKSNIDGGYREEVIFEVSNDTTSHSWTNENLQKTKILFGRYCNCRGQTGLYKIINGNLNIKKSNTLDFELNFKITEVPQITSKIVVVNGKL
jgi:hypothetical protein